MTSPLVSLITVNYNTPEVTAALLQSLHALRYPNWEIIVVDNASPQFSSASLVERFPFITHISSPVNLGFAGGNNLGIQVARGEYIFLVNNDTEVTPDLINILVTYLREHPRCGMVCPKIKYYHQPDTIQYAGAIGLHPLTSRSVDIGYLEKDLGQRNDARITDLPNGAAVMLPRKVIREVGMMSEMFFLYYEELDWAARVKNAGYEVHYQGAAEIYHKESVSTGKNSPFKSFYLFRNRLLYIRRNYQGWRWLIAVAFFVGVSTPSHIMKHVVKREWQHAWALGKALWWNCTHHAFQEPNLNAGTVQPETIISPSQPVAL